MTRHIENNTQWRNKIIETLSNLKTKPFIVVLFDTIRPLVSNFLLNTMKKRRLRDKNEKAGRSDSCRKAFEYFAFPGIISTWILRSIRGISNSRKEYSAHFPCYFLWEQQNCLVYGNLVVWEILRKYSNWFWGLIKRFKIIQISTNSYLTE